MVNAQEILEKHFPKGEWSIDNPPAGLSKQAFIADNGEEKVFIKFDVATPALKRLAEIGVTPPLLFDGTNESRPYVIQEYVEGEYPNKSWFRENLELLASFIKEYQQDEVLKKLISGDQAQSYEQHINKELSNLEDDLKGAQSDFFKTDQVTEGINKLKARSKDLEPVPLVPTHADPNIKNFLLTSRGLMMIDWDDIILSDPMKDIGLMLWWYIPKEKWSTFFKSLSQNMDEEKIFWWNARASLSIALWFDKRGDTDNAKFFLEEFFLALNNKDNSQMINNP